MLKPADLVVLAVKRAPPVCQSLPLMPALNPPPPFPNGPTACLLHGLQAAVREAADAAEEFAKAEEIRKETVRRDGVLGCRSQRPAGILVVGEQKRVHVRKHMHTHMHTYTQYRPRIHPRICVHCLHTCTHNMDCKPPLSRTPCTRAQERLTAGTLVTPASFNAWHLGFLAEKQAAEGAVVLSKKITGAGGEGV